MMVSVLLPETSVVLTVPRAFRVLRVTPEALVPKVTVSLVVLMTLELVS